MEWWALANRESNENRSRLVLGCAEFAGIPWHKKNQKIPFSLSLLMQLSKHRIHISPTTMRVLLFFIVRDKIVRLLLLY